MEDNNQSGIENWFSLNETILKSSWNHQIKAILKKNVDLKKFSGTKDELFTTLNENIKPFAQIVFDNSREFAAVLRIILEFSSLALSMSPVNYVSSFKIFLGMLKTNQALVRKDPTILELPTSYVCKGFHKTLIRINESYSDNYYKFLSMQGRIIDEIQKLFGSDFRGTSSIISTIVDIQAYAFNTKLHPKPVEKLEKLKATLFTELASSNFYTTFFSKLQDRKKLDFSLEICAEILDKVKENENFVKVSMSTDKTKNFLLLTIKYLAENPEAILESQLNFCKTVKNLAQLLCKSNEINFNFTENEVVKMIFGEDIWLSRMSLKVFIEYLTVINNEKQIAKKFVFFQKMLMKIWDPVTIFSTRHQMIAGTIVFYLAQRHQRVAKQWIVDRNMLEVLMMHTKKDSQEKFVKSFNLLVNAPTKQNYYNLLMCLKTLGFSKTNLSQECLEKLCEMFKIIENCNWTLHSDLIVNMMAVTTTDKKQTQILLLKLNNVIQKDKSRPFEMNMKLIELLGSFIHQSKGQNGLRKLIKREFQKLVNDEDEIIKEAVDETLHQEPKDWELLNSLVDEQMSQYSCEEEKFSEVCEWSRNNKITHVCKKIDHCMPTKHFQGTSKHSRRLQMVAAFLRSLDGKQMSEFDRQVIQEISGYCNSLKG